MRLLRDILAAVAVLDALMALALVGLPDLPLRVPLAERPAFHDRFGGGEP